MKNMILLIGLLIAFSTTYCQKSDSLMVNRADLIRKLKQLEDCKVDQVSLTLMQEQNADLLQQVTAKDQLYHSTANELRTAIARLRNYELQGNNYQNQITLQNEAIEALNKSLKKQKRKTTVATIAGIIVAGGLTYLLITK